MKILIIEDDQSVAELERDYLEINGGFDCDLYDNGNQGLQAALSQDYALVIVDVMLPGLSGFEICRRLREVKDTPVIIISALADDIDKVRGLGLGADDYMTKPFALEELVARVRAHLRAQNRNRTPRERERQAAIQIGQIRLDPEERTVTKDGVPVELSTREFDLLACLMNNAGQTLSKEQLFHSVWKTDYGDVGTVAINIKKLRTKIDPEWDYIKTIWGSGYRFVTKSGYTEQTGGAANGR